MLNADRFRGCLIGGAAGDALGYTIEFMSERAIQARYGQQGIVDYELNRGQAVISDDTQMTLFTANGLLVAATRGDMSLSEGVRRASVSWAATQLPDQISDAGAGDMWLYSVTALHALRAPGRTCLNALAEGGHGTPEDPINDSKGCGGVMRVAPISLYGARAGLSAHQTARLGAEAAAQTHGHPLGWLPAAILSEMIYEIVQNDAPIGVALARAMAVTKEVFPGERALDRLAALLDQAADLAESRVDILDAIHQLGEGWVGDEALAIAVLCAMRSPDDIGAALVASVNHKGDSDSTGAVAGNIVGARVGYAAIPDRYTDHLQMRDLILDLADDLYAGHGSDQTWRDKYLTGSYRLPR